MANAGLNTAQMLPRFLLPRLSWQATPAQRHAVRALSALSPTLTNPSQTSEYTDSSVLIRTRQNVAPRSKTSILQNPSYHRAFHATARQSRDHHFDTLKFVQRLQEEGFTEAQSVAMMKVLSDVIEERSSNQASCFTL
jgi:predicted DsbA family dithiol-disulfide isomerase